MTDDRRKRDHREEDETTDAGVSRRATIQGASAVGISAAIGCSGDDGDDDGADTSGSTGGGTSSGGGSTGGSTGGADDSSGSEDSSGSTGEPDDGLGQCAEPGEMTVEELLANVDHIVFLMMENRSFDHYFGALALEESAPVTGLTGDESNPDGAGNDISVFPSDYWVVEEDPPHGWNSSRAQWNEGANDGFVTAHLASGATDPNPVMGYHTREQLPVLHALADEYVLCDQWFASVMGSTWPNRFYAHLGTAGGMMSNDSVSDIPSIWDQLEDAGISNTYYHSTLAFTITFGKLDGVQHVNEFFDACEAGTLPAVSYVDPAFSFEPNVGNDDHPPADIRDGQAFIASVYNALANSPLWDRCLLVITYDEHGGFYDHVSPPSDAVDELAEFRQLGFRVPSLVIGPHVRRGCVTSTRLDHVSIVSTITRKHGLDPLNDRIDQTNDLSVAIDPVRIDDPPTADRAAGPEDWPGGRPGRQT